MSLTFFYHDRSTLLEKARRAFERLFHDEVTAGVAVEHTYFGRFGHASALLHDHLVSRRSPRQRMRDSRTCCEMYI